MSIFMSVGALELVGDGFLIQLSDESSLGLASSWFVVNSGGFNATATLGVGARYSYYFSRDGKNKFLWANAIVVDAQYLLPTANGQTLSIENPGGIGIEAVVGRDGIVNPGVGIIWGFGLAASFHSEGPPLVFPAIRLGLHVDV
jgi:hypothetical protein